MKLPYAAAMASGRARTPNPKTPRRVRPPYAQPPPAGADETLWLAAHHLSLVAEGIHEVAGVRPDAAHIVRLLHEVAGIVAVIARAPHSEAEPPVLDRLRACVHVLREVAPQAVTSATTESAVAEHVKEYLDGVWPTVTGDGVTERTRRIVTHAAHECLGSIMRVAPPLELVERALAVDPSGGRGKKMWSVIAELLRAGGVSRELAGEDLSSMGERLRNAVRKNRKRRD